MKRVLRIFALLTLLGSLSTGCDRPELVFFVSPSGSDTNPGTQEQPFATLGKAHGLAKYQAGKQPVTICLREGTYYLSEPVVIAGPQSGKPKYPLRYTAYPGEKAVVSGARRLQGLHWEPYRDGILQAKITDSLTFDQLYLDGRLQSMARYPNYDSTVRHYHGYSADALSPARVKRWADPQGGYVHALHVAEWGGYQYRITGKDAQGELQLEGGFQNNRQMGMHAKYRMVENIFEELDAPGEWYFDAASRTLYVWPPQGTDLNTALIEVPQLESLFRLEGTDRKPARHVEISGLELRHTLRTFMQTKEPLLRSDWTIYRGGAVFAGKSEHCVIRDCYIHDLGGNALFFSGYNRDARVEGNHITRAGASGVCFVGSPEAVRSPSFEYGQFVPTAALDTIPGPKSEAYPARCTVHDNLIHDIGRIEKQTAAVEISMARGITVSHNSIYDLPRAGINISEGTWGGHLIEGNDVFNTVLETGDHGSFNSWGRDRFWLPDREAMDSVNRHDPRLVGLDAVETTVIRNNRWRCDHGWDIDLDDGSSNYHLYNNLCLNGGIKLREGFHRTVENNIMVNNSFHSHAWFENSGDVFRHNIVTRKYYPIGIEHWGRETDYNLLPDSASLLQAQANGTDRHSLAGHPRFIDPDRGDYRVEETSPALLIGFRNFPMDSFGVLSDRLRALARTPDLPRFTVQVWVPETDEVYRWMGASLKNITTEGERSAAGLDSPRGLFVIGMEAGSPLAQAGLRINDVVLGCNGRRTDRWADLKKELDKARPGERVQIGYYRHQHPRTAEITLP